MANFLDLLKFKMAEEPEQFNMTAPENLMTPVEPEPTVIKNPQTPRAPVVEPVASVPAESPSATVKEYIKQKYGLLDPESYDSEMKKAQDESKDRKSGLGIAQFLAGAGDAIAGRSPSETAKSFQGIRDNIDKETVGKLESRRKAQMDNLSSNSMMDKMQRDKDQTDPNSSQSMAFRKIIESKFPEVAKAYGPDWANVSAADQDLIFKPLQLKEQMEARKETARILSHDREESRKDKKEAREQKDKELSVAQAKQLGLYKSGLLAESQYEDATKNKDDYDPTSVGQIIDNSQWAPTWMKNDNANKAQAAQSAWVEAYLRDASGAAIPPSERMTYAKDYFPQPGDSSEIVENKKQLRKQKMDNAKIGSGLKETDSSPVSTKSSEVERLDKKTGKIAIFDALTKKFLRYK